MRTDKIRAKRLDRFKLNNEGVALIYALMAGTVAMVFCLMLLMISYNLYTQVSSNTQNLQLRVAAESFENSLWSELLSAPDSSLNKYIDSEIRKEQAKKNRGEDYSDELNLLIYYDDDYGDGNTMGNYSVYLTIGYDLNDSSYTGEEEGGVIGITDQRLLDVTIKCMRGIPYPDGSGGYRIDDKESYTIKNTYKMSVNR